MHLLYGDEPFFIRKEISKLKNEYQNKEIINFNDNYSIDELNNEIDATNLFSQPRLFLIYEFPFLKAKKLNKKELLQAETLLKSLANNEMDEFVFIFNEKNFSKNFFTEQFLKLKKLIIKETTKIDKKNLPDQIRNYIELHNGKINYLDVFYLLEKLPDDLTLIIQEIDKLLLLSKNIDKKIIDENITKYPIASAFAFINAVQKGDFYEIYSQYLNQKALGDTVIQLIAQVSWTFVLVNQVYSLQKINFNQKEMAAYLKVNEYRIKLAIDQLNHFGIKKVQKIIKNLAEMDIQLKTLQLDPDVVFEQFLIDNFAK
ncbi:DNA polymerase III subunit delta [Mycoplasma buteonis]|uniref:DNA polymerase III subunit delta n=1 Tax=Mycoplasma buteonis TaxID=171280 RepID=UPI000561BD11|nr:DNA polymerase III subunit delta [Mycoplasma buteonis]